MTVPREIRDSVEARLAALEREYRVRVLYAAESGSRAWGFPSPDSDFDIRFTSHDYPRMPLGQYLALRYEVAGLERVPMSYEVRYDMLFDVDPDHRGFLVIGSNELTGDAKG